MESLYITSPPEKEKLAAPSTTLGDDPALWPKELISALLEQAGYLGQYRVDQRTLGQDDKRGYAYGFFVVSPQQAPDLRPSDIGPNVPQGPQGTSIRIPFIVEKKKLKALAVFIDPSSGKAYPLTQRRVDALLYSSAPLEVAQSATDVSSPTMSGDGQLPEAPGGGMSKAASLCSIVGQTISPIVKEKISSFIANDPEALYATETNPMFRTKLAEFLGAKSKTAHEIKETVRASLPTDAILLEKTADGYRLTAACARAYYDDVTDITGVLQTTLPNALRKEADAKGYAVHIKNLHIPPEVINPPQKIKTSGAYMVQTSTNHAEPALVFTHVRDLEGKAVDGVLVKTAAGHAYADAAYGTPTDNLPTALTTTSWQELPRGKGVFIKEGSSGAEASVPVDITFYEESDGTYAHYNAGLSSGKIRVTQGVPHEDGVVKLAAGLYAANPRTLVSFLPLGNKVNLATTAEVAVKLASANMHGKEVVITHSDGEYSLAGVPVEALGGRAQFASEPETTFYLGLTGVPPLLGHTKLAEAQVYGRSSVVVYRTVATYKAQQSLAKHAAAKVMPFFPEEDYSLLKIAAGLQEENTVDAVLSLNFITPENLAVFVEYLPILEEATAKICELLLAAQLGVNDISETAATRAITALEAITAGLELLQLKSKEELTQ
jgi:hypothetical protein